MWVLSFLIEGVIVGALVAIVRCWFLWGLPLYRLRRVQRSIGRESSSSTIRK
jgi:hypothetical protein